MPTKALVLDDCPLFVSELQNSLKSKNYNLFVCSNSYQAIETAFIEKPDIFLCDWQLQKDINGIVVTEIIKCICDNIKVLFISGFNCFDLRESLKNFDNLFFLEKPFSKKQLIDTIEILESSKSLNEAQGIPVAIVEIGEQETLAASNKIAKSLALNKITLNKISEENWRKVTISERNYFARIRSIAEKKFILLIDCRNGMLLKDPRYSFFLNNINDKLNSLNKCMLVIDEHQAIRSLASEIMLENKIFCHTAISVDEGISILDKDRTIGTVVVDSNFDEQTINKLIRTVRNKNKDIKIVGACASLASKTIEYKFDELLNKPFSAQALVDLLKKGKSHVY